MALALLTPTSGDTKQPPKPPSQTGQSPTRLNYLARNVCAICNNVIEDVTQRVILQCCNLPKHTLCELNDHKCSWSSTLVTIGTAATPTVRVTSLGEPVTLAAAQTAAAIPDRPKQEPPLKLLDFIEVDLKRIKQGTCTIGEFGRKLKGRILTEDIRRYLKTNYVDRVYGPSRAFPDEYNHHEAILGYCLNPTIAFIIVDNGELAEDPILTADHYLAAQCQVITAEISNQRLSTKEFVKPLTQKTLTKNQIRTWFNCYRNLPKKKEDSNYLACHVRMAINLKKILETVRFAILKTINSILKKQKNKGINDVLENFQANISNKSITDPENYLHECFMMFDLTENEHDILREEFEAFEKPNAQKRPWAFVGYLQMYRYIYSIKRTPPVQPPSLSFSIPEMEALYKLLVDNQLSFTFIYEHVILCQRFSKEMLAGLKKMLALPQPPPDSLDYTAYQNLVMTVQWHEEKLTPVSTDSKDSKQAPPTPLTSPTEKKLVPLQPCLNLLAFIKVDFERVVRGQYTLTEFTSPFIGRSLPKDVATYLNSNLFRLPDLCKVKETTLYHALEEYLLKLAGPFFGIDSKATADKPILSVANLELKQALESLVFDIDSKKHTQTIADRPILCVDTYLEEKCKFLRTKQTADEDFFEVFLNPLYGRSLTHKQADMLMSCHRKWPAQVSQPQGQHSYTRVEACMKRWVSPERFQLMKLMGLVLNQQMPLYPLLMYFRMLVKKDKVINPDNELFQCLIKLQLTEKENEILRKQFDAIKRRPHARDNTWEFVGYLQIFRYLWEKASPNCLTATGSKTVVPNLDLLVFEIDALIVAIEAEILSQNFIWEYVIPHQKLSKSVLTFFDEKMNTLCKPFAGSSHYDVYKDLVKQIKTQKEGVAAKQMGSPSEWLARARAGANKCIVA